MVIILLVILLIIKENESSSNNSNDTGSQQHVCSIRYMPMKMASFATGILRPFFVVQVHLRIGRCTTFTAPLHMSCKAAIQAGRYDKWSVRASIEEDIKSARPACASLI